MSAFFGIIGMLGIPVSLVLLVIKTIRRKPKKKTAIALAVFFVSFVVGLCIPSNNTDEPEEPKETIVEPVTPEPTAAPTATPEITATPEPTPESTATPEPTMEPASIDTVKLLLEGFLKDSFDYYDVEGDETGITISVGMNGLADEVTIAKYSGYDENYEEWVDMKENMMFFYDSTYDLLETMGMEDPSLMLSVVNDANTENCFLMIIQGVVVYDVMAE